MPQIFTVEQRGIGKPDYTREISSGRERPGLTLKANQSPLIFACLFSARPSVMSWTRAPLAPGEEAHFVNVEDGNPMPYTLLKGYTFTCTELEFSGTQDLLKESFFDGEMTLNEIIGGGVRSYINNITAYSTALLDPTGALGPHLIDELLTNLGGGDFTGMASHFVILEKVGSQPLPTTKTALCKFCGNKTTVPVNTTKVICSKCGKLTIYRDLSQYRRT